MNDNGESLKKRIVEILNSHPEGLTVTDLARLLDAHRQTITKYILVLEAVGLVYRRRVGAVTLHYLREKWERLIK